MSFFSRAGVPYSKRNGLTRRVPTLFTLGLLTLFVIGACGSGDSEDESPPSATDTVPPATRTQSPAADGTSVPPTTGASAAPVERAPDAAPDFELVLFETPNHEKGEVLRLSDLAGHPVVLNFWFPSCPPCAAEMPDFEASFQKHKTDGVEFIGVQLLGLDTAEDGQKFTTDIGVTYALGPDTTSEITTKLYKVSGFPATFFLDREHRIVREWTGILDAGKIEELIQDLLD